MVHVESNAWMNPGVHSWANTYIFCLMYIERNFLILWPHRAQVSGYVVLKGGLASKCPLKKTFRACPQAACSVPKEKDYSYGYVDAWCQALNVVNLLCPVYTRCERGSVLQAVQIAQLKPLQKLDINQGSVMPGQCGRQRCSGFDPENSKLKANQMIKNKKLNQTEMQCVRKWWRWVRNPPF